MLNESKQYQKSAADVVSVSLSIRFRAWARRMWPPVISVAVVAATFWLGWHVFYEKNGISAWQQKRTEEKQLHKDNSDLEKENARLRDHIERLKTNPDAIGIEARGKLHYIKSNEVLVTRPAEQKTQAQPAGTVK